jgi:hypothetical protein
MDIDYKVIFYYRENGKIFYIRDTDSTNKLLTIEIKEINKPENKFHSFMMDNDYYKTHDDLIKYKNDFNQFHNEIMSVWLKSKSGKKYKLDYKKYHNHNDAVLYYFFSKNEKGLMDKFEPITEDEFYIFERCYNAGLITLNLDYKDKPVQTYGNDYSRYYTNLLLNMKIPTKRGVKTNITEINNKLKFGIYRIKITYKNSKFTNIFNFSKEHHYTSTTLNYLMGIKDDYGLEFELLKPDETYDYNALIYDETSLMRGRDIFKDWFKSLETLKKKYPDNKLVKFLMSSLWGSLSAYNKVYLPNTDDYDTTFTDDPEPSEYKILGMTDEGEYKSVKSSNAYKYPLARLKPFLTAYGRLKIMKLIRDNNLEDNVIRIHTDSIITNIQFDYKAHCGDYYPIPENKTTGLMVYKNAIYGFHICKKCNELFSYKDFKDHIKANDC